MIPASSAGMTNANDTNSFTPSLRAQRSNPRHSGQSYKTNSQPLAKPDNLIQTIFLIQFLYLPRLLLASQNELQLLPLGKCQCFGGSEMRL